MRIPASCVALSAYVVIGHALPAAAQVDQQRAQEYFKEAQVLCERDGGRPWGVSLCGPMVIADVRTKTIATSQPAPDAPWPRFLGLGNAPIEWGGTMWVAFNWDFVASRTPRDRRVLFIHELFHRVQPGLGLIQLAAANEHVDAMDGRYWLRLEWRALARALRESGAARAAAVRDALAFRQARRALYAGSAEDERRVEITEGLPHYTAFVVVAASDTDAIASYVDQLEATETRCHRVGRPIWRRRDPSVRREARARAAGTYHRIATALCRRSGAPDSWSRQRLVRFTWVRCDSGERDCLLRPLPRFRKLGHARRGEGRARRE